MLRMPPEFGTSDELLADVPGLMRQVDERVDEASALRKANCGSHEIADASTRTVVAVLTAQMAWALAAINELQTEVSMLRGDGKP